MKYLGQKRPLMGMAHNKASKDYCNYLQDELDRNLRIANTVV
jgi:hypothetical protein